MPFPHRRWLWLALLPFVGPVAAQQVASEAPQAWQADAKANKQAQKAAETAAEAAAPPPKRMRQDGKGPPEGGRGAGGGPPGGGMGGRGGEDGPPGGGMEGGGHGGGPGGHGRHGKHGGSGGEGGGRGSPAAMLRPEMDFAAPLKDTLILYRSREAVVFGRSKSPDVVMLPLDGTPVTVAPGVQASLHEDAQGLRVEVATSNAIHVTYRYAADPSGELRVAVHAEGPVPRPGSRFDVERVYRIPSP